MFKCCKCHQSVERVRSIKLSEFETILVCPACGGRVVSQRVEEGKSTENVVQLLEG